MRNTSAIVRHKNNLTGAALETEKQKLKLVTNVGDAMKYLEEHKDIFKDLDLNTFL
ncbi:MAG: hypothetical protein QNL04_09125 [SAR324 cluster bacterium]|nr:hypothetical protein [SAR324 cluster bacterium]